MKGCGRTSLRTSFGGRECVVIDSATSIPGTRVVRVLDELAEVRGLPEVIVIDNGPEFTSRALDEWAYRRGVRLLYITSGRPIENAYIESFNGKFRDECLNEHWFLSLDEVRATTERWRIDYNRDRPHSSLGHLTPEEFAIRSCTQASTQSQQSYPGPAPNKALRSRVPTLAQRDRCRGLAACHCS